MSRTSNHPTESHRNTRFTLSVRIYGCYRRSMFLTQLIGRSWLAVMIGTASVGPDLSETSVPHSSGMDVQFQQSAPYAGAAEFRRRLGYRHRNVGL
jgi:hypothetical protein